MTEEKATIVVVGAYHVLLNRSPEYTGLRDWVGAVMKGMTIDDLIAGIKASPEYKAKWNIAA